MEAEMLKHKRQTEKKEYVKYKWELYICIYIHTTAHPFSI